MFIKFNVHNVYRDARVVRLISCETIKKIRYVETNCIRLG